MKKTLRVLFGRLPRSWILLIAGVFSRFVEVKTDKVLGEEDCRVFRVISGPAKGLVFCLPTAQRWQAASFSLGLNELDVSRALRCLCKTGSVVFDLGASVGYHTLSLSSLVGIEGKVYAFEPTPGSFSLLSRTIELNALRNVSALPYAVADGAGRADFVATDSPVDGLGHLVAAQPNNSKLVQKAQYEVMTVSLDEFVEHNHLRKVDLIKMDIEGAELMAFRGMETILRTMRPAIIVELNGDDRLHEGTEILGRYGYRWTILGVGPSHNILAIHPQQKTGASDKPSSIS